MPKFNLDPEILNDKENLRIIIEVFKESSPSQLSEVHRAIKLKDHQQLKEAAHKLKGSIGIFSNGQAFSTALSLEIMGKENNLIHAEKAFLRLEDELQELTKSLTELAEQN